eukprot:scaffold215902_cov31-Tisochrysis_lutea.AAC.5
MHWSRQCTGTLEQASSQVLDAHPSRFASRRSSEANLPTPGKAVWKASMRRLASVRLIPNSETSRFGPAQYKMAYAVALARARSAGVTLCNAVAPDGADVESATRRGASADWHP